MFLDLVTNRSLIYSNYQPLVAMMDLVTVPRLRAVYLFASNPDAASVRPERTEHSRDLKNNLYF